MRCEKLPQQHIKFEKSSSVSSTPIIVSYTVGVKNKILLSAMLISNFTHDKNVHLISLEATCE